MLESPSLHRPPQSTCATAAHSRESKDNDPTKVVMAAQRPDFRRECGREDLNLQGLSAHRVLNPTRLPVPPRPRDSRIALPGKSFPWQIKNSVSERAARAT
jgi:hypothetical protein